MAFDDTTAGVITQSDTDANLSGLDGLSGVSVTHDGIISVYTLTRQLTITGTLTINPELERLVMDYVALGESHVIGVNSGGVLNLGTDVTKTVRGTTSTRFSEGVAIVWDKAAQVWFGVGNVPGTSPVLRRVGYATSLQVYSGGSLNWRGAEIYGPGNIGIQVGSAALIQDAVMTVTDVNVGEIDPTTGNTATGSAGVFRDTVNNRSGDVVAAGRGALSGFQTADLTIRNLTVRQGGEIVFGIIPVGTNSIDASFTNSVEGYQAIDTNFAVFSNRVEDATFENTRLAGSGNTIDVALQSEDVTGYSVVTVRNEAGGTDLNSLIVEASGSAARNVGVTRVVRNINFNATELATGAVASDGGRWFVRDVDNGFRSSISRGGETVDDTNDYIYQDTFTTGASTTAAGHDVLMGVVKLDFGSFNIGTRTIPANNNRRPTNNDTNDPVINLPGTSTPNPYAYDLRGKAVAPATAAVRGNDLFDIHVWHPLYQYVPLTDSDLSDGNTGSRVFNLNLAIDSNYQVADFATANKIETLDEIYKAEKLRKSEASTVATPTGIELPAIGTMYVTASGSNLDLGTHNFVNNPAATTQYVAGAFSLIVSADSLTAGTVFDGITTTGMANNGGLALDYGLTASDITNLPTSGEIITANGVVGGTTNIALDPGSYTISGDASGAIFSRSGSTGTVLLNFADGSTRPTAPLGTGVEAPFAVVVNSEPETNGRLSVYRNGVLLNTTDTNAATYSTTAAQSGADSITVVYTAPGRTDFRMALTNVGEETTIDVVTQRQDFPGLTMGVVEATFLGGLSLRANPDVARTGQLIVDFDSSISGDLGTLTNLNFGLQRTIKGTELYNDAIRLDGDAVDACRSLGNAGAAGINSDFITFEAISSFTIGYVLNEGARDLSTRNDVILFRTGTVQRFTGEWNYNSTTVTIIDTGDFSYEVSGSDHQFIINNTDIPGTNRVTQLGGIEDGDYITLTPTGTTGEIVRGVITTAVAGTGVYTVNLVTDAANSSDLTNGRNYNIHVTDTAGDLSSVGVSVGQQPTFDAGVTEAQLENIFGSDSDNANRLRFIGQGRNSVLPAGESYDPDTKY